jgi:hypothetical protein
VKKVWFIILSLGLTLSLIISIVLPVSANTSYTITVQAVVQGAGPPPVSLAVPVTWSKTGGLPPYSGEDNTLFNIFQAGGDVTLTAPLTTNDGTLQFFVFRQWLVGTPPAQPEIVTPLRTVTFAPTSNKVATAIYQLISSLGSIYPLEPDFNPVGTDHTVWANIGIPVAGEKVMFQIY